LIEALKTKVNPSEIKGFWSLLALLLIVGETIGLLWLYRAESPVERIAAGILMTLIVLAFLAVALLGKTGQIPTRGTSSEALGVISPAQQVATQEQINNPEPQVLSAPDGSYQIDKPPDGWTVRELTMIEFVKQNLSISDQSTSAVLDRFVPPYLRDRRVLEIRSGRQRSIIPTPGKTKVDGRYVPTALEITFYDRLAVLPLDRAQPPFFISRPFEHNFFSNMGQLAQAGAMTLYHVEAGTTQRRLWRADFNQRIANANIDGSDGQDLTCAMSVIGVEGQLQDYLVFVYYASKPDAHDPELHQEKRTLESLVNSFKPREIVGVDERQQEIDKMAEQAHEHFITQYGTQMFLNEFSIALSRLADEDLDDYRIRYRAMELLRPFEDLAKQVGLEEDEELNELWNSLRKAEEGDASRFKAHLSEWISKLDEAEGVREDSEAEST
jgi:hypothetical protein